MAVTTPTLVAELPFPRSGPFAFNNEEDDANAAAIICIAAPGAAKAIYLTNIVISGRTADIAITLRDGDTTVLFGPIQCQGDGSSLFVKDFKYPMKLTDNTGLYVYASAASAFTLYGEYYIAQSPIV